MSLGDFTCHNEHAEVETALREGYVWMRFCAHTTRNGNGDVYYSDFKHKQMKKAIRNAERQSSASIVIRKAEDEYGNKVFLFEVKKEDAEKVKDKFLQVAQGTFGPKDGYVFLSPSLEQLTETSSQDQCERTSAQAGLGNVLDD